MSKSEKKKSAIKAPLTIDLYFESFGSVYHFRVVFPISRLCFFSGASSTTMLHSSNKQTISKNIVRTRHQIKRGCFWIFLVVSNSCSLKQFKNHFKIDTNCKRNCSLYGVLHGGNAELVSLSHHSKFQSIA